MWWAQIVFGVIILGVCLHTGYTLALRASTHLPPSIRGIWTVEEFVDGWELHQPLLSDDERWQRVIFDDRTH